MANRRMFSKLIVQTDAFMEMPPTSQLLYFHLAMEADDDGFVSSPKKVMKTVGSAEDDYKILIAKRFIIPFESGVCVIKHWLIHNFIRNDRYSVTQYVKEKELLQIDKATSKYQLKKPGMTLGIPDVIPMVDPGKDRLGKDRLGKDTLPDFDIFWESYPLKVGKEAAKKSFSKIPQNLYPTIMEALEKQKSSGIWKEAQYTPHASTWLNQKRWEDEVIKSKFTPQELYAMECVKKWPLDESDNAMFMFARKYSDAELLKVRHIIKL